MRNLALAGVALYLVFSSAAAAQKVTVRPRPEIKFPAESDSNSPATWINGELVLYNSTGMGPMRSSGPNQSNLRNPQPVVVGRSTHYPYWIESTWLDEDGTLFAWYHWEPQGMCNGRGLTAPKIGALVSRDGGKTFSDLGIVLETGYPIDCSAKNGYFAGGHGDFTVLLSRNREYFYFLFSNYSGPLESQGVVAARMPFHRRNAPYGAVQKFFEGRWLETGIGGRVSPIFQSKVDWKAADADSFWGPSVHWNRYLGKWVMLLNRSCCAPGWPQEGVYVSYNESLANANGWSEPEKILSDVFWYPQVIGRDAKGTDKLADRVARLYIYGTSEWELVFHKDKETPTEPLPPEEN